MSTLSNTLSNNSFYITNKKLIKALGPNASMILTHLIDQHKYLESKNELQPDGSFFCYAAWIMDNLNIGKRAVEAAMKLLEKKELISSYKKGLPARKYFILNEINILAIIEGKESNDSSIKCKRTVYAVQTHSTKGANAPLNKNKINKNKPKQELPSGELELDLIPEDLRKEELRSSKDNNATPELSTPELSTPLPEITPEHCKRVDDEMMAIVAGGNW